MCCFYIFQWIFTIVLCFIFANNRPADFDIKDYFVSLPEQRLDGKGQVRVPSLRRRQGRQIQAIHVHTIHQNQAQDSRRQTSLRVSTSQCTPDVSSISSTACNQSTNSQTHWPMNPPIYLSTMQWMSETTKTFILAPFLYTLVFF